MFGEIDKLIDNDEISPTDFLPKTAAGRCGQDMGHADFLQRVNIGPVIHLGRTELMFLAVPGHNHHIHTADLAHAQRAGGFSVRCIHIRCNGSLE